MKNDELLIAFESMISEIRKEVSELSIAIWNDPEIAFKEFNACRKQVAFLKEQSFHVTSPFGGLDTAFSAEYGSGHPAVLIVSEYDALPEIGHGCGHNLICGAALAAGAILKKAMERENIQGRLVILGTPAEESGGGKVLLLSRGCLDGIDCALMLHPSWRTMTDGGSTAVKRFIVEFKGKAAHAAISPELGCNALDAVMLLFNAIGCWRQQLPESGMVHGIITNGGTAPNIIPEKASCFFYLRATGEEWIEKLENRFRNIIRGAELMTDTVAEVKPFGLPYKSRNPNHSLNQCYFELAEKLGMNPVLSMEPSKASSDFGDFSHVIPGIQPYFGISDHKIAGHSSMFAEASKTGFSQDMMFKGACAIATVSYIYLTNHDFRGEVHADFNKKRDRTCYDKR